MEPLPDEAWELAEDLIEGDLCDVCLGRTVAKLGYGLSNAERGQDLRDGAEIDPEDCPLCRGLAGQADRVAELAIAAAEDLDHGSFALGCRVDDDVEEAEEQLWADHGLADVAEPIRTQLTREAGKVYEAEVDATFDPDDPEVTVIVDPRFWAAETEITSVYVQGRYRKVERGIPQTRWHCWNCNGRGCVECDGTGKRYATSVEEEIAEPALSAFEAQDAVLHGQGREDVDARMLGDGRPFVLEVKRPRRRSADLDAIADAVETGSEGAVEVLKLRQVGRDAVPAVKNARSTKTYRAEVAFEAPVGAENLKEAARFLEDTTIRQRTPSRVAHRRADRVRKRDVHRFDVDAADDRSATVVVRGDAGLYVKELISGDDGRTEPSLAGRLDVEAEVVALDVTAVEE